MPDKVEAEKRRNRALKALQMVAECGDDPREGLAALDMARSGYEAFLGEYRAPKDRFTRLKSLAAVIAFATLSVVIFEAGERAAEMTATAYNGPPLVWGSARFTNDIIEQGDNLEIIASHKYMKACDWSVKRDWYQGKKLIATTTINLPPIPVDSEFMTRRWPVETPRDLKPGVYSLKASLRGTCEGNTEFQENAIFEQNFRVVPVTVSRGAP